MVAWEHCGGWGKAPKGRCGSSDARTTGTMGRLMFACAFQLRKTQSQPWNRFPRVVASPMGDACASMGDGSDIVAIEDDSKISRESRSATREREKHGPQPRDFSQRCGAKEEKMGEKLWLDSCQPGMPSKMGSGTSSCHPVPCRSLGTDGKLWPTNTMFRERFEEPSNTLLQHMALLGHSFLKVPVGRFLLFEYQHQRKTKYSIQFLSAHLDPTAEQHKIPP